MNEPAILQVILMGMITVFVCLIILIFMITAMGKVLGGFQKEEKKVSPQEQSSQETPDKTENQRIIAAISVAIAESLNKDVSQIRIHSIRKL
ncbi:OadG family protein [Lacrimispora sp.]|uniref:OadG family protein n=1 Tax=Lacrimispora sp. TaxID=2719234 RepID=UPI002FDA74C7